MPDEDDEPYLLLTDCGCGNADCKTVIFAMGRPQITLPDGEDPMEFWVQFPLEHAQALVDKLRLFASEKGFTIK